MARKTHKPVIRSVKFNVLMNIILTSSTFLFPLITVPYVSRVLGPTNNGIVSWAFTFVGYFTLVAMLGFSMYGTKECAKVRDDRKQLSILVQELLVILMSSTAIVYIAYIVFILVLPRTRDQLPLMLIASTMIWLSAFGAEWFYRAIEQYGYITFRNIAFKLAALILMFIFVRQTDDYLAYAIVNVIGSAGSNVLNVIRLRSFITFSRKYDMRIARHFKAMFNYSISSITSGMYAQVDMLLLGFFTSNFAIGLYQLVFKTRNLCTSIGQSVTGVMLPRLSYYESRDGHEKTMRLMAKNFNFLYILGLSIISALVVCADPIIAILGGDEYLGGSMALRLSAPVILFSSLSAMQSQYMIAADKDRDYTITTVVGLVTAVVLECVLIPLMGINGAALGISITECVVFAIRSYMLRNVMQELRRYTDYGKIFISWLVGSACAGATYWTLLTANPFVQIIAAAAAYLLSDGLLLLATRETFLREMLSARFKGRRV